MTRRIAFITVVGAALVLAAPAFGKGERFEQVPQWQQALIAKSEGMNKAYGLGTYDPALRALELRSEALNRQHGLGVDSPMFAALDARERALEAKSQAVRPTSSIDAREESFAAKREAQLVATSGPDAFERTVIASTRETVPVVADDRFRIDPTTSPVPVETTSGREIEWPQVGVGLGIGLLLGLCLVLAVRYTRIRPLAH